MDYTKIAELIAGARPGARVLYIEIPVEEDLAVEDAGSPPESPMSEAPQTDLTAASAVAPTQALTVSEWADLLHGVSGREIERAIKAEVLSGAQKGHGRDWAALVIPGQGMVDYLAMCEAVQTGSRPAPEWWSEVRKGPAAEIYEVAA